MCKVLLASESQGHFTEETCSLLHREDRFTVVFARTSVLSSWVTPILFNAQYVAVSLTDQPIIKTTPQLLVGCRNKLSRMAAN